MPLPNPALDDVAELLHSHRVTVEWLKCYLKQQELALLGTLSVCQGSFPLEAALKAAASVSARGDSGEALVEALLSMSVLQRADSGGGSGGPRLTMHLLYRELAPKLHARSCNLLHELKWHAACTAAFLPAALLGAFPAVPKPVLMSSVGVVAVAIVWAAGSIVSCFSRCSVVVFCSCAGVFYYVVLSRHVVIAALVVIALVSARAGAALGSNLVGYQSMWDQARLMEWFLLDPDAAGQKLAAHSIDGPGGVSVAECRDIIRVDDANFRDAAHELDTSLGTENYIRMSLSLWPSLKADLQGHVECVCRTAAAMVRAGCARRGEQLARVLVRVSSNALGKRHPVTLAAMAHRASSVHGMGDWQKARELQEEVLALRKQAGLGLEHQDTLAAMSQLALTLASLDEHAAAFTLQGEVLAAMTATPLGRNHRLAQEASNHLAGSLWHLGEHQEATLLAEKAVEEMQKALGPRDPSTLAAVGNLAGYYCKRGERARAQEMQEGVLTEQERVLGADHPCTLTTMCELAQTLSALGKLGAARGRVEKALELGKGALGPGPTHPITLAAKACLGNVLRSEGALAEARQLEEEVLAAYRERLGPGHHLTVAAMAALDETVFRQNRQLLGLPRL
jgi:tetratricopeptide (TPR) repeat protein